MWPENQGVRETLPWAEHTSEDVVKNPHFCKALHYQGQQHHRNGPEKPSSCRLKPNRASIPPCLLSRFLFSLALTSPPFEDQPSSKKWRVDITGTLVRVYDFYPFVYLFQTPTPNRDLTWRFGLNRLMWDWGSPSLKFFLLLDIWGTEENLWELFSWSGFILDFWTTDEVEEEERTPSVTSSKHISTETGDRAISLLI